MEAITFETLPRAITQLYSKVENIERLLNEKNQSQPDPDKLFNIEEAANFLGVVKTTMYGKVARREIPYHKRAKRLYFFRSELQNYIKSGRVKTCEELRNEASDLMKRRS